MRSKKEMILKGTQWIQQSFLFFSDFQKGQKDAPKEEAGNVCSSSKTTLRRAREKKTETELGLLPLFGGEWEDLNRRLSSEKVSLSLRSQRDRWLKTFQVSSPKPLVKEAESKEFSGLKEVPKGPRRLDSITGLPKGPRSEGFLSYLERDGWQRRLVPTKTEIDKMSGEEKWRSYCHVAEGKFYELSSKIVQVTRGLFSLEEALQEIRLAAWIGCNNLAFDSEKSHLFSYLWRKTHWHAIGLMKEKMRVKRNGYEVPLEDHEPQAIESASLENEVDAEAFFSQVRRRIASQGSEAEQRISAAFFRQKRSYRAYASVRKERRFVNSVAREAKVSPQEVLRFLDGLKTLLLQQVSPSLLSRTL